MDGKDYSQISTKEVGNNLSQQIIGKQPSHLVVLEARIMLDAAAAVVAADAVADASTGAAETQSAASANFVDTVPKGIETVDPRAELKSEALPEQNSKPKSDSSNNEVIFVDSSIENFQTLIEDLNNDAEVIILDSNRDGVEQIAETLADNNNLYDSIHIISHGAQAQLGLGNAYLTLETMQGEHASELGIISEYLTDGADIFIYGCNFGQGELGQQAAFMLADATGADIAASNDITANQNQGGDWQLEVQVGNIANQAIVSTNAIQWMGNLNLIVDSSVSDNEIVDEFATDNGIIITPGTPDTPGTDTDAVGTFNNNDANTGLNNGVILTTGDVDDVPNGGTNINTNNSSTNADDAELDTVTAINQFDVATISFDFTPEDGVTKLAVQWVFATEEATPAPGFNDAFGIFIQEGALPWITLASGDTNSNFTVVSGAAPDVAFNEITAPTNSILNGVNDSATFTFKAVIADANDAAFDSGLFIEYFGSSIALDLDANDSSGAASNDFTTTFTENSSGIAIVDSDISIVNFDNSANIQTATINLTNAQTGDQLLDAGVGAGFNVTGSGTTSITLTAVGVQTEAAFQNALSNIQFINTSDNPSTVNRNINIVLNDGTTNSNTATTTVQVVAVNDPPMAENNTNTVVEDTITPITGNVVTDNDPVFGVDSDPEGDNLAVTEVNSILVSGTTNITGNFGVLTIDSNGLYSYLLDNTNPTVQALNSGDSLTDNFVYTINDGNGGTDSASLDIIIDGVNDVIANDDSFTTDEATILNIDAPGVIANDSFPGLSQLPGITSALSFDNSNAFTESFNDLPGAPNPTTQDASFEIWIRPDDILDNDMLFETGANVNGLAISLDGTILNFDARTSVIFTANASVDLTTLGITDPTAEFIQVVGVVDVGNTLNLYVNGVLVDTATAGGITDWAGGNNTGLGGVNSAATIGGTTNFEGDIAVFRFYESALSAADVLNNFQALTLTNGPSVILNATVTYDPALDTNPNDNILTGGPTPTFNLMLNGATSNVGLSVIEINGNAANIGNPVTLASGAVVTLNADGSFQYDPNGQFNDLLTGQQAIDSFTYTLTDSNGSTDTATVNITITGIGNATVTLSDANVNENAGTITFVATLDNAVQGGFSVDALFSDLTANSGSDYDGTTQTINFAGNANETQLITLSIIDDSVVEANETFSVSLGNLVPASLASAVDISDSGLGTIIDNDNASVTINDVTVNEAAGTATFTATLDNAVQGGLSVETVFTDGTAINGSDYSGIPATLNFVGNAGEVQTIVVGITDDLIVEANETFIVSLTNLLTPTAPMNAIDISDSGLGTIIDNDNASVTINEVTVNEADGTATFTATLDTAVQGGLSVETVFTDGTAINGTDYTGIPATLNFIGNAGEVQTIVVGITDDLIVEANETFTVSLGNLMTTTAPVNAIDITDTGLGTIIDNDNASVTINEVTVNEADGTATFTATLDTAVQGGLSVETVFTDGTAVNGTDYTGVPATLNFIGNAGETQNIVVSITDDLIVEANETFIVSLTNLLTPTAPMNAIDISDSGLGTIIDNDNASVTINEVTVNEADGTATFNVTLDTAVQGGLSVETVFTDGTAVNGTDYTGTPATLNFIGNAGETQNIVVSITDDLIVEANETFVVSLTNLMTNTAPVNAIDISDTGLGTIIDNDNASITINEVTVNEGDGMATFTATLDNAVQGGLSVETVFTDGTAINGTDYTGIPATLNFIGNAGEVQTIIVNITDDLIVEANETFVVSLTNLLTPTAPVNAIDISDTGLGTIIDNDNASVTINEVTVNEADGTATFNVTLDTAVQGGLSVETVFTDGTAVNGVDYTGTPATLNFIGNAGEVQTIVVGITDDLIVEANETFLVSLTNLLTPTAPVNAIDISDTGLGTIIDNDAATLTVNDVTVNEADGTATFTATLDTAVQGGLSVETVFTDGTAINGTDYTGIPAALSFIGNAGEVQTIVVGITDDLIVEANETFVVSLTNLMTNTAPVNAIDISDTGLGTIIDNDNASVTINEVTVNEADGTATFNVTLDTAVQGGLSVETVFTDGTAINGTDYSGIPATLNFVGNAGEVQTIIVNITDDLIVEANETFTISLANLMTATAPVNAIDISDTGLGTIIDNDAATLSVNDVTVNEADGTATFNVTLDTAVQGGLSVETVFTDGTAINGTDYTGIPATLNFVGNAGEVQTIVVGITDDLIVEANETFVVSLTNLIANSAPVNAIDISDTGLGTIVDNDNASVTINEVTVNEADGTATFNVTLDNAVQGGLNVDTVFTDGTAINGTDYTGIPATLNFVGNAGEVQTITVNITDDLIVEANETFVVSLTNLLTATAPVNAIDITDTGLGTIIDNDNASVTINEVTVNEADGTATFTATLDNAVQGGLSVETVFTDGTAVNGVDYTGVPATLNFVGNAGEVQTIVVGITDDLIVEANETFVVSLTNLLTATAPVNAIDISDTGLGTIIDNDNASVTINDVTVNEADGTATFNVTLDTAVQGGLSVETVFTDGTAVNGTDYTGTPATLTFIGNAGEVQTIVVGITDDLIVEANETFVVSLRNLIANSAPVNAIDISDTGLGTIIDNDNASVTINDVIVNEADGTATFNVTLDTAVQGGLSVETVFTDGTAINGTDYTGIPATLNFIGNAGEVQNIVVSITDDLIVEANETFTVSLANLMTVTVPVNAIDISDTGLGTIIDNDNASVTINEVTVNEADGTATFNVTLDTAVQGGLSVETVFTDGTAINGTDYTGIPATLTFIGNAGEVQNIVVSITDDLIVEANETFVVSLTNLLTATAPVNAIDISDTGLGTIIDNDNASVTINEVTVNEADGTATFNVTLDNAVQGGLSVETVFTDGTAVNGTDYTGVPAALSFIGNAGEVQTIIVSITDDLIVEANETFVVSLTNLMTNTAPVNAIDISDTGLGTIIDNDNASITINEVTVNEADGTATFTATLDNAVQGGLSVDTVFTDGTAINGTDYTGIPATLNFIGNAGETQTITVNITDDLIVEANETFTVSLANLMTATAPVNAIDISDTGLGTIIDNDAATLSVNDVTVNEADGTATFNVTLDTAVQGGLSVETVFTDGTAVNGTDYTGIPATLNFIGNAGEVQTITVNITDDLIVEANETFVVSLANLMTATAPVNAIDISDSGLGTIIDNDNASVTINDVIVNEADGTATFNVTLDTAVQGGLSVETVFTDGTAINGTDYTGIPATLTFVGNAGEVQTITVNITDDLIVEANETFIVSLTNLLTPTAPVNAIDISDTGLGTIIDNDNASVTINDVTVNEADGTATFTATLDNAVQGGLSVETVFTDGTAVNGVDYTGVPATLNFVGNAGETQNIVVSITDDLIVEANETFVVSLTNLIANSAPVNAIDITDTGLGTIIDNDAATLTINDVTVNEADGTATFTATLDNPVQGGLSVETVFTDGTAINGTDYTGIPVTLNFIGNAGEVQTITVNINDDLIVEANETFTVSLTNLIANSASVNAIDISDTALGTILNNDTANVNLSGDVIVNEAVGSLTFTATLDNPVQGGFTVETAFTDITAINNIDYVGVPEILTFTGIAGEVQSFDVFIKDDQAVESNETFVVSLTDVIPTNPLIDILAIDINDTATVTIVNNDVTITDNPGLNPVLDPANFPYYVEDAFNLLDPYVYYLTTYEFFDFFEYQLIKPGIILQGVDILGWDNGYYQYKGAGYILAERYVNYENFSFQITLDAIARTEYFINEPLINLLNITLPEPPAAPPEQNFFDEGGIFAEDQFEENVADPEQDAAKEPPDQIQQDLFDDSLQQPGSDNVNEPLSEPQQEDFQSDVFDDTTALEEQISFNEKNNTNIILDALTAKQPLVTTKLVFSEQLQQEYARLHDAELK